MRECLKWDFWKRLAESWQSVLDSYIKYSPIGNSFNDLPYWHSERAATGFLAAAAWKIKGVIAIEEYYAERVYGDTKRRSIGHCDLWVRSKDFSFSAEVKQLWPKNYKKKSIQKKIKDAEKQLDSLADEDKRTSNNLFSVCFVSPRLDDKVKFSDFLNEIQNDFTDNDIRIFYYDRSDLPDNIITWKNTDEKYPGVIMLIKEFNPKRSVICQKKVLN